MDKLYHKEYELIFKLEAIRSSYSMFLAPVNEPVDPYMTMYRIYNG